jgi:hypothetical protein
MMNTNDNHDRHDRFLVAALAAGDLETQALTDAEELVASCSDCAELLADLRSIAAATAALPLLPRSTDFRLSPETAERLGARGWRGLLVQLADSRFGFSRPLAVGLTTLGLVGVIAGSIPGAMGGASSGGAPFLPAIGNDSAVSSQRNGAAGAPAPPASAVPGARQPLASPLTVSLGSPAPTSVVPGPTSAPGPTSQAEIDQSPSAPPSSLFGGYVAASPPPAKVAERPSGDLLSSSGTSGPPPLLLASLVLLLIGLGILGAQWAATRLTNRSADQR